MKTSHKLNDYGNGYVGFSQEGRERSRVGVKFLGSKSWLRRGNRGRGTQRKYGLGPPLQEEETLSLCFRSFCLVPKLLPKMREVFCSQYKKKLFNSKPPKEHEERQTHCIYTKQTNSQLQISNLWSPTKPQQIQWRREQRLDKTRTQDQT